MLKIKKKTRENRKAVLFVCLSCTYHSRVKKPPILQTSQYTCVMSLLVQISEITLLPQILAKLLCCHTKTELQL